MELSKTIDYYFCGKQDLLEHKYTKKEIVALVDQDHEYVRMHLDVRNRHMISADGRIGLLDVCGNELIPAEFDEIPERLPFYYRTHLSPVVKNGKYYIYDIENKKLLTRGYDRIFRYFDTTIPYFVAEDHGKKGLLDGEDCHELTPIELDEIYTTLEHDSFVPMQKDGKWGGYWDGIYCNPIFDKMETESEKYAKVWLSAQQGWIDSQGRFTVKRDKTCWGSWYERP